MISRNCWLLVNTENGYKLLIIINYNYLNGFAVGSLKIGLCYSSFIDYFGLIAKNSFMFMIWINFSQVFPGKAFIHWATQKYSIFEFENKWGDQFWNICIILPKKIEKKKKSFILNVFISQRVKWNNFEAKRANSDNVQHSHLQRPDIKSKSIVNYLKFTIHGAELSSIGIWISEFRKQK